MHIPKWKRDHSTIALKEMSVTDMTYDQLNTYMTYLDYRLDDLPASHTYSRAAFQNLKDYAAKEYLAKQKIIMKGGKA